MRCGGTLLYTNFGLPTPGGPFPFLLFSSFYFPSVFIPFFLFILFRNLRLKLLPNAFAVFLPNRACITFFCNLIVIDKFRVFSSLGLCYLLIVFLALLQLCALRQDTIIYQFGPPYPGRPLHFFCLSFSYYSLFAFQSYFFLTAVKFHICDSKQFLSTNFADIRHWNCVMF